MSARLERLIRLRRTEVDRQRQVLAAASAEVEHLERQIDDLRQTRQREQSLPGADPLMLASYLRRTNVQEEGLHAALRPAVAEHEREGHILLDLRLDLRRLEILDEHQSARRRGEQSRRDQRALDDLVLARHRRRGPAAD